MKRYELTTISQKFKIQEDVLLTWIECQLISPFDPSVPIFDEEDLSRIEFILEMKDLFQTNDDSMQVIMHLIDQIHLLQIELKKIKKLNTER